MDKRDRQRLGWWLVTAALAAVLLVALHGVLGTLVLALFAYYGMRPAFDRIDNHVHNPGLAATLTAFVVLVPVFVLVAYTALLAVGELAGVSRGEGPLAALLKPFINFEAIPSQGSLQEVLRHPGRLTTVDSGQLRPAVDVAVGTLQAVTTGIVHVFIAFALAFFSLRDGYRLRRWSRAHLFPEGGVADSFLRGVDRDLEVVFVGNVMTVLLVAVVATVMYNTFNAVAPAALTIPVPTLLALLTALATFVPIVVGKLVYVPIFLFLILRALGDGLSALAYAVGFLALAFVVLDVLPQMALQPYLSGRTLHVGLVMAAYVLGATIFGWYGLFLGPLLLVLAVHLLRTVVPELLHGDALTPDRVPGIGSDVD